VEHADVATRGHNKNKLKWPIFQPNVITPIGRLGLVAVILGISESDKLSTWAFIVLCMWAPRWPLIAETMFVDQKLQQSAVRDVLPDLILVLCGFHLHSLSDIAKALMRIKTSWPSVKIILRRMRHAPTVEVLEQLQTEFLAAYPEEAKVHEPIWKLRERWAGPYRRLTFTAGFEANVGGEALNSFCRAMAGVNERRHV
jgi:hypothetical protein